MPTLHLGETLLDEMKRLCERAHPAEACGLMLGRFEPREGKAPKLMALRLHPARNVHASAGERFEIAPEDFVGADSAARDAGLEIVGVYHSHPRGGDGPSPADREGAQESWPSVIVALKDGRAESWRCWQLADGEMSEQKICVC